MVRLAAARIALLTISIGLGASAETASQPLTLPAALERFRSSGFDLLIADAGVAGVAGDAVAAAALPNPQLSLARGRTATYDPSQCPGCSNTSVAAGISDQALSDLATGKRSLRVAVAKAALDIAKTSRADVERTIELTVKQQLLQAELANESLRNARAAQQLAASTLALVQTRYKAGAVSEADVARADVQKLEADQAVDAAEQALAAAKAALAYLLGYRDPPAGFDVGDDLVRAPASPRLAEVTREGMLREAVAHRPDLAGAALQIERAQSALELARRQRIPDFAPSLSYSAEGRGQSALAPPTVTLGIAAGVPLFYRNRGEIARATADLRAQELTRTKVEAQIAADVSAALAAFESAKSRTARMDQSLLSRAARARDLVRLQYEKGAASLFEFLDAQRTWLATQSEYLQTINDYWTAVFQLEQATGTELHS